MTAKIVFMQNIFTASHDIFAAIGYTK